MTDNEYVEWLSLVKEKLHDKPTETLLMHMYLSILMYLEAEKCELNRDFINRQLEKFSKKQI